MSLLVIVLCLLSERFLVHKITHNRFHWFMSYAQQILSRLDGFSPVISLTLIVLPPLLLVGFVLLMVNHLFFDIMGLLLNVVVFYYCIGPINPFYPVHAKPLDELAEDDIGNYLLQANEELFAVLFWYIVLGPLGVLAYRLISLSKRLSVVGREATDILALLDWLPVRMTALLYLLVGNFQAGFVSYRTLFFSAPSKNNTLLNVCGLAALNDREPATMLHAENLVEHATVVFLVFLAFCTIVAWV